MFLKKSDLENPAKNCPVGVQIFNGSMERPEYLSFNAPINVNPEEGGGSGKGWGFDQSGGPMGRDLD